MKIKCDKCQSGGMKYEMIDEFNHLEEVFTCSKCGNQISYDEVEKKKESEKDEPKNCIL